MPYHSDGSSKDFHRHCPRRTRLCHQVEMIEVDEGVLARKTAVHSRHKASLLLMFSAVGQCRAMTWRILDFSPSTTKFGVDLREERRRTLEVLAARTAGEIFLLLFCCCSLMMTCGLETLAGWWRHSSEEKRQFLIGCRMNSTVRAWGSFPFPYLFDLSEKVNHRERERVPVEMNKKDEE